MATASPRIEAFPYPGEYRYPSEYFELCSLAIDANGAFRMEGMHCPYPEPITRRYALLQETTGQARVRFHQLQLDYDDALPADPRPHQELLVLRCDGGVRFITVGEQRTVALATHSADLSSLRVDGGFTRRGSGTGGNCDPEPLPPELASIARTTPIRAFIRAVESSHCSKDEDAFDCRATVRIDRGARDGIVQNMSAFSLPCDKDKKYVMTVSEVGNDSANVEVNWTPAAPEGSQGLIGTEVTTRIPGCLAAEWVRWERKTEEKHE
jgi:hypothetical protein